MIYSQIKAIQKDSDNINLEYSFSETEIVKLFIKKKLSTRLKINCYLDDKLFQYMGDILKELQELSFLEISIQSSMLLTQQPFSYLAQSFIYLKNLKFFILDIQYEKNSFNDNLFCKEFGLGFTNLQNLILFQLNIPQLQQLTLEGAKSISEGLQNLNYLTDISYKVGFSRQQNKNDQIQVLKSLCNGKTQQKCLLELQLILRHQSNISDQQIKDISEILQFSVNLQIIELRIEQENNITAQQTDVLSKSIQSLQKLKYISIFVFQQFNLLDFLNLIENLFLMKNLEKLEAFICLDYASTKDFKFGKQIQQHSKLKKFQLSIINTTNGMRHPPFILEDSISNLSYLTEFEICLQKICLYDKSYLNLSNLFKRCMNLNALTFKHNNLVIKENIEIFKNSILDLKNLWILQIYLGTHLNDKNLYNFFLKKSNKLVICKVESWNQSN